MNMTSNILDTGIKLVKNVGSFNFGAGCLSELSNQVSKQRKRALSNGDLPHVIFLVDTFFRNRPDIVARLQAEPTDYIEFVNTAEEPTTDNIDNLVVRLKESGFGNPATIVGMGGGSTLDTAKAVANLLTNGGRAAQYQGWDLVRISGIHKIGIPTLSAPAPRQHVPV
jgi:3-deoxy-alpha-D-manno-octulosonate 8-oxidase